MQLHIGIDDTDSKDGGCTTHIAASLVEKILKLPLNFTDYPNIIRLNPNIPYKTRGNAAIALRLKGHEEDYPDLRELVLEEVEKGSKLGSKGTDPGVVFLKGRVPTRIKKIARQALWTIVDPSRVISALSTSDAEAFAYGNTLGLVGATAAIGETLDRDHTFELVAYRRKENYGKPRRVDRDSVIRMDELTAPFTFNNYDYVNKRVLIAPHGPDPVLVGIRGENAQATLQAFRELKILEPFERWVIFRTNHGTDSHFDSVPRSRKMESYSAVVLRGEVAAAPTRIRGGHVFFPLQHAHGIIQCAAFEPTGAFRNSIAFLSQGDVVEAYGGVRPDPLTGSQTLNLEKLILRRVRDNIRPKNPKGESRMHRLLTRGVYIPASKAHRHLTKPLERYGREKNQWSNRPPMGDWHRP